LWILRVEILPYVRMTESDIFDNISINLSIYNKGIKEQTYSK